MLFSYKRRVNRNESKLLITTIYHSIENIYIVIQLNAYVIEVDRWERKKLHCYIYVSELVKLHAKDDNSSVAKNSKCNTILKSSQVTLNS